MTSSSICWLPALFAKRRAAGCSFLGEGNAFDAALVALDLSISYLQQGNTAEVRQLADEMVIVFRDLEVAREPMAALRLFQEAARRETATAKSPLRSAGSAGIRQNRSDEVWEKSAQVPWLPHSGR